MHSPHWFIHSPHAFLIPHAYETNFVKLTLQSQNLEFEAFFQPELSDYIISHYIFIPDSCITGRVAASLDSFRFLTSWLSGPDWYCVEIELSASSRVATKLFNFSLKWYLYDQHQIRNQLLAVYHNVRLNYLCFFSSFLIAICRLIELSCSSNSLIWFLNLSWKQ